MNRIGIARVLQNTGRVFFGSFGIVLFIAVIAGGIGWVVAEQVGQWALRTWPPQTPQQGMAVSQIAQMIWLTLWGCVVGSWAAPASLYLWVQHEKGRPATLYEAVNFGLNRFPRVLPAHARALFVVQLGMVVFVPGILFGLQYAFVDAIASLDNAEKDPLARSRKLTAGRRGTLFRTFAVFLLWWLPFQTFGVFYMPNLGTWSFVVGGVIDALVLIAIDLCMVQYYLDLFRKPAAAPEPVPQTI